MNTGLQFQKCLLFKVQLQKTLSFAPNSFLEILMSKQPGISFYIVTLYANQMNCGGAHLYICSLSKFPTKFKNCSDAKVCAPYGNL